MQKFSVINNYYPDSYQISSDAKIYSLFLVTGIKPWRISKPLPSFTKTGRWVCIAFRLIYKISFLRLDNRFCIFLWAFKDSYWDWSSPRCAKSLHTDQRRKQRSCDGCWFSSQTGWFIHNKGFISFLKTCLFLHLHFILHIMKSLFHLLLFFFLVSWMKSYLQIVLERLPPVQRSSSGIHTQQAAKLQELVEFIQSQVLKKVSSNPILSF